MTHLVDAQTLEWSRATLDPVVIAARKRVARLPAEKLFRLVYAAPIGSPEPRHAHDASEIASHPEPASGPGVSAELLADWSRVRYAMDRDVPDELLVNGHTDSSRRRRHRRCGECVTHPADPQPER